MYYFACLTRSDSVLGCNMAMPLDLECFTKVELLYGCP